MAKNILLWLVIAAVLLSVFQNFSIQTPRRRRRMKYSEFIEEIQRDQVRRVVIDGLTYSAVSATTDHNLRNHRAPWWKTRN